MNMRFWQLSFLLSLSAIAAMGDGLSVRAETANIENFVPTPTPETIATSAAALAPLTTEPASETSAAEVAQTDPNAEPAPDAETIPIPDSAPNSTTPAPITAVGFTDIDPSFWAYPFIQTLAANNLLAGFPDGTYRPEQLVTRAQFAAMLQKAFPTSPVQQPLTTEFVDVTTDYWAAEAIQAAYEAGFMAGYPNNFFLPNGSISKAQAITSLASGLSLAPVGSPAEVANLYYTDAEQIPSYAVVPVVAATQANIVVNYPDVKKLNPEASLTRAEAAAHLYQALVRQGRAQPLPAEVAATNYIVGASDSAVSQAPPTTPEETPQSPEVETEEDGILEEVGEEISPELGYIGVGGSLGLIEDVYGDVGAFAVISKLRFFSIDENKDISLRPSFLVGENVSLVVPVTFDLRLGGVTVLNTSVQEVIPYIGPGFTFTTDDDVFYFSLTGGLDVPIGQFTTNAQLNLGFLDDFALGLTLGIGYNF